MCRWETTTASTWLREIARDRPRPPVQVHEGGRQHRVGEDPCAVLDEHGGVPEPVDLDRHVMQHGHVGSPMPPSVEDEFTPLG